MVEVWLSVLALVAQWGIGFAVGWMRRGKYERDKHRDPAWRDK